VTPELLAWADVIFVMEKHHRNKVLKHFSASIRNQKIVVLGITDDYEYMDGHLVQLFEALVPRHLGIPLKQNRGSDAGR
jgi:predicted protein tyrosine phosphatase